MENSTPRHILKKFVVTYFELLNFMKDHSKHNSKFLFFYNKNLLLRKSNIKIFIKYWYEYVTKTYHDKIMKGDLNYMFSEENYNNMNVQSNGSIMQHLIEIKTKYDRTDSDVIKSILVKVQELTSLSILYFNSE